MVNDLLIEATKIGASYIAIIVVAIMTPNWLTKGFLLGYMTTKFSRGKLILLRVKGMAEIYFKPAKLGDKLVTYKGRDKKLHSFTPLQDDVYVCMGVPMVDYDEVYDHIITIDGEQKPGIDSVLNDSIVKRGISLGQMMQPINQKLIMIVLIVIIIGLLVIGFKVFDMSASVTALTAKGVI